MENPKIEGVFKDLELIGRDIRLRLPREDNGNGNGDGDGSVTVVVDPDPGVTETITCTEMVCSSSSFRIPIEEVEMKLVLSKEVQMADTAEVRLHRKRERKSE